MSTSWKVPAQLNTGVPASVILGGLLPIQVPKHTAIKITAIYLNGIKDLLLVSKAEGFPDGGAAVNKLGLLAPTVVVHGGILV